MFFRFDDKTMPDLKENGLKWVSVGAESGSQRILDCLNKGIKVEDIKSSVEKLKKFNISCDFSFMGGLPGEAVGDFMMTLDLESWMKDVYPDVAVIIFRFVPYPEMPILKNMSNVLSRDTYGWSKVMYQNIRFSWVPRKINSALHVLSPASFYSFKPKGFSLANLIVKTMYYLTQLRFKMRFFYFLIEGILVEKTYSAILLKMSVDFRKKVAKII